MEANNQISFRLPHLEFMLKEMGIHAIISTFRTEDCLRFVHWLEREIDLVKNNKPEGDELHVIDVPISVVDVAVFVFSKMAYKILCDNVGLVNPQSLLYDIQSLKDFKLESVNDKPRRLRGDLWDVYVTKEAWLEDVESSVKGMVTDIIETLRESDEVDLVDAAFDPQLKVTLDDSDDPMKNRSSDALICLNLSAFTKNFRQDTVSYNAPEFIPKHKADSFSSPDYTVALLAMAVLAATESYRVYMRRAARRANDEDMLYAYDIQNRDGFINMYLYLIEHYVEPRLDEAVAEAAG